MTVELTGHWFGAALGAALLLGLLLLALRPRDRASVRNALIILGAAALTAVGSNLAGASGAGRLTAEASVLLVGMVLLRLAVIFVFRIVVPLMGGTPARIVEDLSTAGAYLFWAIAWLRLEGVDLASLVTTSAVITAVVAFSMQETLGNVLGGVVLQLDRSIRAGDWVQIESTSGRVVEVTWRHTAVQTRNGETLVVPNGWMMKNRFMVIGTRADPAGPWRRWIRLNVDLAAAPADVCRVLEDAVRGATIENVAAQPAPSAVVMELGPRHGGYALRYWMIDRGPDDATDSRVRIHILAALARNGMKLGAPYQEEFAIHEDEQQRTALQAAEQERRTRALAQVDLFAPLADAERAALAPHLRYAPFVAGDVMTRQGAVAHWLYLVISGTADVTVETPAGRSLVGKLEAGDIFGEMGMLTGAPRTATVTARTDTICYRLDKAAFESVIRSRPDIAESISRVLADRRKQLDGELAAAQAEERRMQHDDILEKVRRFFGLTQG